MSPNILRSFYTCTVESILTGCIIAWFGNNTAGNHKALQRVVRTARHIVGGELPSLQDIYTRRCTRKARRIIKDSSQPSYRLLSLLPSGRRLCSIRSRTSRLRDSFFPSGYQANEQKKTNTPYSTLPLYNMHCTLTQFNWTTRTHTLHKHNNLCFNQACVLSNIYPVLGCQITQVGLFLTQHFLEWYVVFNIYCGMLCVLYC